MWGQREAKQAVHARNKVRGANHEIRVTTLLKVLKQKGAALISGTPCRNKEKEKRRSLQSTHSTEILYFSAAR